VAPKITQTPSANSPVAEALYALEAPLAFKGSVFADEFEVVEVIGEVLVPLLVPAGDAGRDAPVLVLELLELEPVLELFELESETV